MMEFYDRGKDGECVNRTYREIAEAIDAGIPPELKRHLEWSGLAHGMLAAYRLPNDGRQVPVETDRHRDEAMHVSWGPGGSEGYKVSVLLVPAPGQGDAFTLWSAKVFDPRVANALCMLVNKSIMADARGMVEAIDQAVAANLDGLVSQEDLVVQPAVDESQSDEVPAPEDRIWSCQVAGVEFKVALIWEDGFLDALYLDGESGQLCPFATLSIYPDRNPNPGCIWLKNYSENEDIAKKLLHDGLLERTGRFAQTGFISVPECEPTAKLLAMAFPSTNEAAKAIQGLNEIRSPDAECLLVNKEEKESARII